MNEAASSMRSAQDRSAKISTKEQCEKNSARKQCEKTVRQPLVFFVSIRDLLCTLVVCVDGESKLYRFDPGYEFPISSEISLGEAQSNTSQISPMDCRQKAVSAERFADPDGP